MSPFGLKHKGYNNQITGRDHAFDYLGQERHDNFGLNWVEYRYRQSDPAIGRFFGVDPVSSEYMSISTYQFAHNNPVWKIEIEGLEGTATAGVDVVNNEPVKKVVELSKSYVDDAGKLVLERGKQRALKRGGVRLLGRLVSGAVPIMNIYTMYEIREASADLADQKREYIKSLEKSIDLLNEIKNLQYDLDEQIKIADLAHDLKIDGDSDSSIVRMGDWLDKVSACEAEYGCEDVADEAVAELGEGARYLKITSKRGGTLGPVGGVTPIWFIHIAAIKNGRVYDRLTGQEGMPFTDYVRLFEYFEELNFEIKEHREKD